MDRGLLAHALEQDVTVIEPTPEAEDEWVAHIHELAGMTLWPKADSWCVGANVRQAAHVHLYAGGVITYHAHCAEVAADGYRGFALTQAGAAVV